MQPIPNGPEIPDLLLQAHEEGDVVFFCGAGVSYPAGLPGFSGLVTGLFSALGVMPSAVQQAALKKKQFDTAIGLLEQDMMGGRAKVRAQIARILTADATKPGAVASHEALLTLAKSKDGQIRLITTNFDRLFEAVIIRGAMQVKRFQAPLLPIPKARWDGLVYLHGLLPDDPTSSVEDLNRLVASSGDFGLAYLTERWASRFVTELFRNYTVCFVGYSIDDPVLRYMMDALAADKLLGEAPIQAYAFGAFSPKSKDKTEEEWDAKNVTPIPYRKDKTHSYLHKTLQAWAGIYRDGITGKESIVVQHAHSLPVGSTLEDNYVGRMLWALSDRSGLPARRFADLDPLPPLDWLEAFSEDRFSHIDLPRFGVTPDATEDKKLAFSLTYRPTPYSRAPRMSLVSPISPFGGWDEVMGHLCRWLTRHLYNPKLLLWVTRRGGLLNPLFARWIDQTTRKTPLSGPMAAIWQLVLTGRVRGRQPPHDFYEWLARYGQQGLSLAMRFQLRELLSPRVMFGPLSNLYAEAAPATESAGSRRARDLVDFSIELSADYVHLVLKDLKVREGWQNELPSLLSEFTGLLKDALDLMSALQGANSRSDLSYLSQPSIEDHSQNNDFYEWTALIELTRDSWLQTLQDNPARAKAEVERWMGIAYPVFRRLVFFALTKSTFYAPDEALDILLGDDAWWLWSTETQRETRQLMTSIVPGLGAEAAHQLEEAILRGPPKDMYENADPALVARVIDHEKILRLVKVRNARPLGEKASAQLDALTESHPEWQFSDDEREDFPVWTSAVGDWRPSSHIPTERHDLVKWLLENPKHKFEIKDDWYERCQKDFKRTSTALLALAKQGNWEPVDRWREALQAYTNEKTVNRSWRYLRRVLVHAPDRVIDELAPALGWWLEAVSKGFKGDTADFFSLVRKILELRREEVVEIQNDKTTDALNHPIGRVVEAIFHWWYRQDLKDGQRMADPVLSVFNAVTDTSVESFKLGRVILAANVITLFRVDAEWTREHVLPLFDWELSEDEALGAWKGLLWSPRVYPPLMALLKKPFLATVTRYAALGEHASQYAGFLTYVALEFRESFSWSDLASTTRLLPVEGLKRAAQTIYEAVAAAGDKRKAYWDNRVSPYLLNVWPKSSANNSAAIAESLARLCIAAQDAFPQAFSDLEAWLIPPDYPGFLVHMLEESKLCEQFPTDALKFLSKIIGDNAKSLDANLLACLDAIQNADPNTATDPKMRRLRDLQRRLS
jgi:hypothetical protein